MLNLMIVEDNSRARRALRTFLSQQAGINVIAEASNGQEAITRMTNQIPDVALMDVRMPVMDGLDATKIIKQAWPQVRIVILSMYSDYQVDAFAAGADAFVSKGSSMEELTGAICGLLRMEHCGMT